MIKDKPIVCSLLDTDVYKWRMLYFIWKNFRFVPVKFAFTNRTKSVGLANFIDEGQLMEELQHVRNLKLSEDEIQHICQVIPEADDMQFVSFLRNFSLPDYLLECDDDTYRQEAFGFWPEATMWETFMLSINSQLYAEAVMEKDKLSLSEVLREGRSRLEVKINKLRACPEVKIIPFDTRRRFSFDWQEECLDTGLREISKQIIGVSNVYLARKKGVPAIGTMAHELFMVAAGIAMSQSNTDQEIRYSQLRILTLWYAMFGDSASIALSDTFGRRAFFEDFRSMAKFWRGMRQDSGDPFIFGEETIAFYQSLGINPLDKTIVFSDGLDVDKIIALYDRFESFINMAFGWGTNWGNDLGIKPLSLVVKAIQAYGFDLVKLSDNLAKAIGPEHLIERYKKIFGYISSFQEVCRY